MTRIKNTNRYPIKTPSVYDYVIGTDSQNFGKTVNFRMSDILGNGSPLSLYADGLKSGGVVWLEGMTYEVSPLTYFINNSEYSSEGGIVTLANSDDDYDRIDVFSVNADGDIIITQGTPSSNPVKPEIGGGEVEISFSYIPAGSSQPQGTSRLLVYGEGVEEPNEFNYFSSSNAFNFQYVADVRTGNYSMNYKSGTVGIQTVYFSPPSTVVLSEYSNFHFYIKLQDVDASFSRIQMKVKGTQSEGSSIWISNGDYGLDFSNLTDYQSVIIPLSAFGDTDFELDFIIFELGADWLTGFILDDFYLTSGTNVIGTTGTWLGLTDTPDYYEGQAGKIPRVNNAETALEFTDDSNIENVEIDASTYTLLEEDIKSFKQFLIADTQTDVTITIPETTLTSDTNFISIQHKGTGTITIQGDTGVTFPTLVTDTDKVIVLVSDEDNVWFVRSLEVEGGEILWESGTGLNSIKTVNGFGTASGAFSTAFGVSTKASGDYSAAFGLTTEASNNYSTAWGYNTKASGSGSTAWGTFTEASGDYSTAWGTETEANGDYSTAFGRETKAESFYETSLGHYSTDYTPNSTTNWDASDRLFNIGNGNGLNRKDALTILKNGETGIGIDNFEANTTGEKLQVNGTVKATAFVGDGSALTGISGGADPIVDYNASTNTPTLANTDTGNNGKEWLVTDAGTVDFGDGDIELNVGDILSNDGSVYFKKVDNNQSNGVEVLTAVKTADETITSSNTVVLDSELQVELESNSYYSAEIKLMYEADEVADLRTQLEAPSGSNGMFSAFIHNTTNPSQPLTNLVSHAGVGIGSIRYSVLVISIYTGSAGTFGLKWAQNTPDPIGTILKRGSSLTVTKL